MDAFNQYLGRPDSAEIPSNAVLQALIRRYPWFYNGANCAIEDQW